MGDASTPGGFERLEAYLQEDPSNPLLLADTCDAALARGEHARARTLVERARQLGLEQRPWAFRLARVCLAAHQDARARELLLVARDAGLSPALVDHDLAFLALRAGKPQDCSDILQSWLERDDPPGPRLLGPMQALWLRASHHLHRLDQACAWAEREHGASRLAPEAQGVASLIAVDGDRFGPARAWADAALAHRPDHLEALLARACVALAEGATSAALECGRRAVAVAPAEGRAWSTLGMASLQAGRLADADAQLQRAVQGSMSRHIGSWHALGWALLLQRDQAGAKQAFVAALQLDGNFAESHGALGLVLAIGGPPEAAAHHLEAALRLDRQCVSARFAQALLRGEAGHDRLQALAARLLDRPGFFGGTLFDAVGRAASPGASAT